MLNYLIKDRASLGYYGLATVFILGLNQITGTVQAIATPYFSEKSNNKADFLRVLKKYQRLIIILSLSVMAIAMILIPIFVKYFFGPTYQSTSTYFRILALKYFFWSCYALIGVAVLGLGMMKYNLFAVSISVPISMALSYFFIGSYGAIGAAIGQALAYLVSLGIVSLMGSHAMKAYFRRR